MATGTDSPPGKSARAGAEARVKAGGDHRDLATFLIHNHKDSNSMQEDRGFLYINM